jgi:hypothetical protein
VKLTRHQPEPPSTTALAVAQIGVIEARCAALKRAWQDPKPNLNETVFRDALGWLDLAALNLQDSLNALQRTDDAALAEMLG